jgi:membrane-associated phospholipid phosphatase
MTRETQPSAPPSTQPSTGQEPAADSRHGPVAQLLIAWSPLSVILLTYALAAWITASLGDGSNASTNRLGFGLHVSGPPHIDQTLFGAVPSAWLQAHLVDGSPHWYDAAAALVYVTHLVSLPLATAFVWFRMRDRFAAWVAAVLTLTTLGIVGYVLYPAAPPWLASDRGVIGTVHRLSDLGWSYLHLDVVGRLVSWGQGDSNPVAAMPSLHAGVALLVGLFFWPLASTRWRAALAAYALSMAVALVYTGEHYVVDVLVGWLVASVAFAVSTTIQRRRTRLVAAGSDRPLDELDSAT